MRFNASAYEKVFPRKAHEEAKVPEPIKPGNILEEADKVIEPTPEPEPEPEPEPDPVPDVGGGE